MQDRGGIPGSDRRVGEVATVRSKFAIAAWSYVGTHGPDGFSSLVHRGKSPTWIERLSYATFPRLPGQVVGGWRRLKAA